MDKRLNDIIGKLVARRDAGDLSDEDFAYLSGLVAKREAPSEGDARPLWYWVHERAAAWREPFFDLESALELSETVDAILSDAGAKGGPFETSAARWITPVTREGLRRSLRRHLVTDLPDDDGPRGDAALLVGLAGFDDLAPLLVTALNAVRAGQRTWWDNCVLNALRSLVMLDHPAMADIAKHYVKVPDQPTRMAARTWAALHASQLDDAALKTFLAPHSDGEWGTYVDLLGSYPDATLRAIEAGANVEEAINDSLSDSATPRALVGLGRIAVERKWKDSFKSWLAHSSANVRGATALAACWTKAKWARAPIVERLDGDEEDDEGVRACLAAAAVLLDGDPDARIEESLAHESESRRIGAVWACIGRDGAVAKVRDRLQDSAGDVCAAAACVTIASTYGGDADAMDLVLAPALKTDHLWRQHLTRRALEVAEVAPSPEMLDFIYGRGFFGPERYADARRFYTDHQHFILRWSGEDHIGALQTEIVPERARVSLECDLENTGDQKEITRIWLELACVGGPVTPAGRLRGRLIEARSDRRVRLDDDMVLPAVLIAMSSSDPLRVPALTALGIDGARIEPLIAHLLITQTDDAVQRASAVAALELDQPSLPVLADVKALLSSTDVPAHEIASLTWIEFKLDFASRAQMVGRLADERVPDDVAVPLLRVLSMASEGEVSRPAFKALLARRSKAPWVNAMLDLRSRYTDWETRRQAAEMLGQSGDERVIPRLLEMLADTDGDVQNATAEALMAFAEKNPSLGLVVLDIRDPERVKTRFGLTDEIDYSKDAREEALRLLLKGLDGKKDSALARKHRGRKVVVNKVTSDGEHGRTAVARPFSVQEFEALALYLRVDFADDETGSIVADVEKDASGEVLSALLQTESLIVASAAWS